MAANPTTMTPGLASDPPAHREYLDRMVEEGNVAAATAEAAWHVFESARAAVPGLPVPATATSDGGIGYQWDDGPHHLTIVIESDGACDWYYRDRRGDSFAGAAFSPDGELPAEVARHLALWYSKTFAKIYS